MYCRNYSGTVSHVPCREVHYTVSILGRVHYQRFLCVHAHKPLLQCMLDTDMPGYTDSLTVRETRRFLHKTY